MTDIGTGIFKRFVDHGRSLWLASGGLAVLLTGGLEALRPSSEEMLANAHRECLQELQEQAEHHRLEMRLELEAQFKRFAEALKLSMEL